MTHNTTDTPIRALMRLASSSASGELIAVLGDGRTRILFQKGRIAWASTGRPGQRLTDYLQQICFIDDGMLAEVVDYCREQQRPLGDALIERGIATKEQFREALKQQVAEALDEFTNQGQAQTLFRPSAEFAGYDAALTFGLSELAEALS